MDISFASGSLGRNSILKGILELVKQKIDVQALANYDIPVLGYEPLRAEIAAMHGTDIDNVMITSSAQQALYLTLNGKQVHFQEPAYFGTVRVVKDNSVLFSSLEDIPNKRSTIYLTSNFHNPTGVSLSEEEKERLAKHLVKTGSTLIEDNPYDLLYYTEKPSTIFERVPTHTLYISSFSKILAPGLRVGYILGSQQKLKELKSLKMTLDLFTSSVSQQMCHSALLSKHYFQDVREGFKAKRDIALELLEFFPQGFYTRPGGGIFIHFTPDVDINTLSEQAKAHKLLLEPDRFMYKDNKTRNTTRINFVQNSERNLKRGIERLAKAYEEVRCLKS